MKAFVGFVIFVVLSIGVLFGLVLMGVVPEFTVKTLVGLVIVELVFLVVLFCAVDIALERS